MKVLLSIIFICGLSFSKAKAAEVCIVGVEDPSLIQSSYTDDSFEDLFQNGEMLYSAAYSCKDIKLVTNGLTATTIVIEAGALVSACTGAGFGIGVALQSAALGVSMIQMHVSNLDCVDEEQEAKIKEQVDDAVCKALNAQGIGCYPPLTLEQGQLL